MMIYWRRLNIYLVLAVALALICGCASPEHQRKKLSATLRVHLETNRDGSDRNKPVPIYRDNPFMVNVENEPFIDERQVKEARLIEVVGGFALRVQLNKRGTWLLESYSVANRGKHIAIFSQFVEPSAKDHKLGVGRWIAAPMLSQRITDGVLLFTPDATREEAYQIVIGLNNFAKKNQDYEPTW